MTVADKEFARAVGLDISAEAPDAAVDRFNLYRERELRQVAADATQLANEWQALAYRERREYKRALHHWRLVCFALGFILFLCMLTK